MCVGVGSGRDETDFMLQVSEMGILVWSSGGGLREGIGGEGNITENTKTTRFLHAVFICFIIDYY